MIRGAVMGFAIVAVLGLGALALAGAADRRDTAFALEIQSDKEVVTLSPGQRACQGPVVAPSELGGVELWLAPVRASGATLRIAVTVEGPGPASAQLNVRSRLATNPSVRLSRTVPARSAFWFCVQNDGPAAVTLLGAPAEPGSGTLQVNGRRVGLAAAAVFLRPHSRPLLGLLPTVFGRAALFRPAWMGAWTFWLLLASLLATFPVAAIAAGLADREDCQRYGDEKSPRNPFNA